MPRNRNLSDAKKAKYNEYYTLLSSIEDELKYYKNHFRNKTVLCNCDDPTCSNFFLFFSLKFRDYQLKRLLCTCYKNRQLNMFSQNKDANAIWAEYKGEIDDNGEPYLPKENVHIFNGDGDFRSDECINLLNMSDIVVTNPPFSLFRKYVSQLMKYNKKFLIIGSINAVTYQEVFPLIKENRIWLGLKPMGKDMLFNITEEYGKYLKENFSPGGKYRIIKDKRTGKEKILARSASIWFTNLEHYKRHEPFISFKNYNPEEYPFYDNFDAIEVKRVELIPIDYEGVMGVPISFLDNYCPEQFEIVGITKTWFGAANKKYAKQIQVNKDGSKKKVTKLNDGAAILVDYPPIKKTYYIVEDKIYIQVYPRLLIRKIK